MAEIAIAVMSTTAVAVLFTVELRVGPADGDPADAHRLGRTHLVIGEAGRAVTLRENVPTNHRFEALIVFGQRQDRSEEHRPGRSLGKRSVPGRQPR